jgi:hypothetical protein
MSLIKESNINNEKQLSDIKSSIDKMNKTRHIEVLKLLSNYKNVKMNLNKSGCWINMSFLPEESIVELQKFVNYIEEQEKILEVNELQKLELSYSIITESI